jgi:hypothetical protein
VALLVLLFGLVPSVAFADNCSGQRVCFASLAAAAAAAAAAGALAGAAAGTMGTAAMAANRVRKAEAYQAGWNDGRAYWRKAGSWRGYFYQVDPSLNRSTGDIVPDQYSGARRDYGQGFWHGVRSLPPHTHVDIITRFAQQMRRWGKALGAQEGTAIPGGGKG